MLTTTEAAALASVGPSTIKRWADQGLLPFVRTPGGHRRFDRFAIDRLLREQPASVDSGDPVDTAWVTCLVGGRRHEIDGRLLEARARLGSWCHVADELAGALAEMGAQWERGHLTIAQEHVASDALARALARAGDALPIRLDGPRCLLACAGEDEHTLGLSLADLCLREVGWIPLWLGRRTPVAEVVRLVGSGEVAMVVLSASLVLADDQALRAIANQVGGVCKEQGVDLLLGGGGAWPTHGSPGVRLASFRAFHDYITNKGDHP